MSDLHAHFRQRERFAREVRAEARVRAPAALVWRVLTDFERYPEWNPLTPRVVAKLEPGAVAELHVTLPRRRPSVQREVINRVEPERVLCWGLELGRPELLITNRFQVLEPLGAHATRYVTYDQFSGWLVPVVFALYGEPMRAAFSEMALALAAHCEREHACAT